MAERRPAALVQAAQADLLDRVGAQAVLVGGAARDACGLLDDEPLAVVRHADPRAIAQALRIARARHLPVQIRSQLPSARPAALRGALVIDAGAFDQPPGIDTSRRLVRAGAALPLRALDASARRARLCLPALPAWGDDEPVGAWLGAGAAGCHTALAAALVSATVVTGSGRIVALGGADLVGMSGSLAAAVPELPGLLRGAEGRLGVVVEATWRLEPAPWSGWLTASAAPMREGLLALLSAARQALGQRLAQSVVVEEGPPLRGWLRLTSARDEDDLAAVGERAMAVCERHGLGGLELQRDAAAARTGAAALAAPWTARPPPALELHCAWPDAPHVLDVVDALADVGGAGVRRWALGAEGVTLALWPAAAAPDLGALVRGLPYLLDAGAVPTRVDGAVREAVRDRVPSQARVLLHALARAFDPDDVLVSGRGVSG